MLIVYISPLKELSVLEQERAEDATILSLLDLALFIPYTLYSYLICNLFNVYIYIIYILIRLD